MDHAALEQAILNLVERPGYQPLKPRAIARRLNVPKDELADLKKAVKRLIKQGVLAYGPSHLVMLAQGKGKGVRGQGRGVSPLPPQETPAPSTDAPAEAGTVPSKPPKPPRPAEGERIVGTFRRNEAGYGFVRPARVAGATAEDIYIAQEDSGDASTGDKVAVRLGKRGGGRKGLGPRGQIVEILKRETHRFVGTYLERAGEALVNVDGAVFARPIAVGDPGAHPVQPGHKVVLEIVRFPSHVHDGEGVITEVLGPPGVPGVDTLSVLREFNLPEAFPEAVLEDARRQAESFEPEALDDRLDLTGQTIITIDPEDARDFDDAISLERTEEGWRLGVHIADVAHFVRPKSALEREAKERATSVYLPDRVIPMLPEMISNSLASLQPGKVRLARTVFMDFTAEGVRTAGEVHRSAIKSTKRLTYEQVDAWIAAPEALRPKLGAKVCELLGRMRELAAVLRARRRRRGYLELAMPEVKIQIDKEGRVTGARVMENTESHQVIEEFMVSANECVAELLRERGFSFLRRIHQPPELRKLKMLREFVTELGLPAGDVESRFGLQKLLDDVVGRPEQHAVNYALLRSLQRAVYSPEEEGHFALASDCYCHFTSPIRRYPDITVHRLLDAVLDGSKPHGDLDRLAVLGEHCSDREQRAEAAERELTKLKLLGYLEDRIGEEMDAVITGVESFGLFVQGLALPAEGLVHIDSMADDYYQFDRAAHTLCGRRFGNSFRLGDVVRVSVAHVDLERRELDFRLVGRKEGPPRSGPPRGRPRGKTLDRGRRGGRGDGRARERTQRGNQKKPKGGRRRG